MEQRPEHGSPAQQPGSGEQPASAATGGWQIAGTRLANQGIARPDARSAAEVVRRLGAVQAQDYLNSLWGIGLRMMGGSESAVEQAVARGEIVRSWPMRGTIHFMAAEDARWMLALLARRQNGKIAGVYRRVGLTAESFALAGKTLARVLAGGQHLTRSELYAFLTGEGIETAGEQRGLLILHYWAQEGLICLGPRRGKQATYALLEEWVPSGRQIEGEEALAELARRYFTGHGPATLRDFIWWSGLTLTEARRGLEAVRSQLAVEQVEEREYWSGSGGPAHPAAGAHLLPPFDEFSVGYNDRSAFAGPDFARQAQLVLGPILLVDGRLAGSWRRTLGKRAVTVELRPLTPPDARVRAALAAAAERYARFLELTADLRW
jgi:hypothetical protein